MPGGLYFGFAKRAFDILFASVFLMIASPVAILVAAAVMLESPGPILYVQERIGRGGRAFLLYKFRSMTVGAERKGAGILIEKNDPRITRVGRIIRKLSLDEIPQLVNVLKGDMSVVGPRPGLRYQVEQYDEAQRRRLLVRPGVTGWAQVNGRNSIDWGRRIELDLEYIERASPGMDLLILLKTIPSVLKGSGMLASHDYWKERARARATASDPNGTAPGEEKGNG